MILYNSFFINKSGLFDFDMTFLSQFLLFFLLSLAITKLFLEPISKKLEERSTYISQNLQKVNISLALSSEKLEDFIALILEEEKELNRKQALSKNYLKHKFQKEIESIQKENQKLINQAKASLSLQSIAKINSLAKPMNEISELFFNKKISSDSLK